MSWGSSARRIGQLCSISSSKRIHAREYEDSGVPFYRGKEIIEKHQGLLAVSVAKFISEERFREIERKHGAPQAGDLLLTSVGTLGVPYVVKEGERFYFKDGNLTWFRDFEGLDVRFLYFWLLSPAGKEQLKRFTIGSSQPAFTIAGLKDMEIDVPPLHTQKRIAAILSAYDDLIENNTRRIAILEEMARRLYEEWLLPQADQGGWSEVPVSETIAGHIGGGWGKEDADEGHPDRAFVIRGTDIPGARVSDVEKCPLRFHAESNLRSRHLADGDLVMEVSGGSKDQLVGRPLLVSDRLLRRFDAPVMCASFCKKLQVKREVITPLLLYHYLSRAYTDGTMAQFQVQSTGITNFQFKPFLEKALVPKPPRELQSRFQLIVGPMRDQIGLLGEANANLRAQRDLLLPKLVSGEIDVRAAEAELEAAE